MNMTTKHKQSAFFLFFFTLVHLSALVTHTAVVHDDDRVSLLAIKSMITNDPQGVMSSWNDSVHFCQWQGVSCGHRHIRVTELNLTSLGLLGSLSPFIGNLSFLRVVVLQSNSFSGEIPLEVCRLFRLEELSFFNNSFHGNIPACLTNCSNLQYLLLGNNTLVGKIPRFIGNLTTLRYLRLSYCGLGGSIPDVFHRMSNLTYISLAGNNLVGTIPPSLYTLFSLEYLNLDNNRLTGTLPMNLGSMLPRLQIFYLYDNRFTGPLPPSLLSSPELQLLNVARNNFSGKLAITSREVCNLYSLSLSWNSFGSGEDDELKFIDALSVCRNLQMLDLSHNQMRGFRPTSLPPSICNINLHYLDVSNNGFDGVIPQCLLGNITSLAMIDLGNNVLKGTIPNVYHNCKTLEGLILTGNKLQGEVPRSLSKCRHLKVLDLGNNHLSGTFPIRLQDLPHLQVLVLKSNHLHGSIKTYSSKKLPFPSLRVLDLSCNRFVGHLPREYFQNFKSMKDVIRNITTPQYLDTGYIDYSPKIVVKDSELFFEKLLIDYIIIDLSSNRFYGEIPNIVSDLRALKVLNLSHNNLNGPIPYSFGNLSEIESLDLSRNQLTGEIPQNLALIKGLAVLNVSQNHLTGRIPQGKQFNTFSAKSFGGNPGLCGFPLPGKCEPQSSPKVEVDGEDEEEESGFTWKVVMLGYGFGILVGLLMGYFMLLTGRPKWFTANANAAEHLIMRRRNKRRYAYISQ